MGILQKAERDPEDCIFGNSCKRQKMIPKDVLEESVVKPYRQGVLDEDTNLGVTEGLTDWEESWGQCKRQKEVPKIASLGIVAKGRK